MRRLQIAEPLNTLSARLPGHRLVRLLLPAALLWLCPVSLSAQTAQQGEALFQQKCIACHTIGQGKKVGPDLKGVTKRQTKEWLETWLKAPSKVLAAGDPTATQLLKESNNVPMPDLGLSPADIASLLAYLSTQDGTPAAASSAPPAMAATSSSTSATTPAAAPSAPLTGDALRGEKLFAGATPLANGGPACMSCHAVSGIGALGGGKLGPDLSGAFGKFGGAGLHSILATTPFPTMQPIFGKHPLTPHEQASLYAFFQTVNRPAAPGAAPLMITILALVGFALLMALSQRIWRRRLHGVRRPLVWKETLLSSD